VTKWYYIRRKNACSMCGKSYLAGLKNQARLHHTRFDPENLAVNTFEVCDDPGD